MPIRRLSQQLINKIAAGEVIERPASVVKELMENSVDAGATRIEVSVAQGGLELIRVSDDGSGIAADELPLALASHATSKLGEADDLFRIETLGFRGEALASIAAVSRLVLRSRRRDDLAGAQIEAEGGRLGEVTPCGCPPGTQVEVHRLFFNTPVRRKFLRAPATEFGHVSEAFTRIALALPRLHCTLRHNDREVFDVPPDADLPARVAVFFGRELADQLIPVEGEYEGVRIAGYVAHPSQSRSHNRMQYLFLNGRAIRDRALQHALGEAYRGLLMTGRYPIAFLSLTMPPELVDVNVHPTKMEVRFQDSGRLYSQLLGTLRTRFLSCDLRTSGEADTAATSAQRPAAADDTPLREQLAQWAKGRLAAWGEPRSLGQPGGAGTGAAQAAGTAAAAVAPPDSSPLGVFRLDPAPAPRCRWDEEDLPEHPLGAEAVPRVGPRGSSALQIHNRYLVVESSEGVAIIDQHALHERILYEQLRRRLAAGPVEIQQLLVPEAVDLSPAEAATVLEHREVLARIGLRVEPFGGSTVLVTGFPAMLANFNAKELLCDLVGRLIASDSAPQSRDLLDDLLHTLACKAAVKAGQRLSPEEIDELLQQRTLIDDAHHCPHGRPTELVFTREELDRQFRRT